MPLPQPSESFATYLAKYYIAKRGYKEGTVPEAALLAEACDFIFTYSDGFSLNIYCLIDREAHPAREFPVPQDVVLEIGQQCQQYTGMQGNNKHPVLIEIIEIGPGVATAQNQARLQNINHGSIFAKTQVRTWLVDTETKFIWNSHPLERLHSRGIRRLLLSPRIPDADLFQPPPAIPTHECFPVVTIALLLLLVLAFIAEQVFSIGIPKDTLTPNIRTLLALGGLQANLVMDAGEWYRLMSMAFLHVDTVHLLLNAAALLFAGVMLEKLLGRAWLLNLFVIGTLGGSLMSLAVNAPAVVSVGSSGAVMGLLAAALVISFRLPVGNSDRTRIQHETIKLLVPALLPIFWGGTDDNIDYASHLGGALAGAAVSYGILKSWRASSPVPEFGRISKALSMAGAVAILLTAVPVMQNYQLVAQMIPDAEMSATDDEMLARADELVSRYPADPRGYFLQARARLFARDTDGAILSLRQGLAQTNALRSQFPPTLTYTMQALLALALSDKGNLDEARQAAAPACVAKFTGQIRLMLDDAGLCR